MNSTALIALDWGTTRARAYRIDAGGQILGTRSEDLGVQRLDGLPFADALERLIGPWREDHVPCIACGMIGSRQGWREAPYVGCPASLSALSSELVETDRGELAIVPGLSTRDASGVPDVMRGEETQILGAVPSDAARTLVVLPGTHSKWARVERGVVLDFVTFMTGELFEALIGCTILGRMAATASGGPGDAFVRGAERGLGPGPTLHDVFGARTLALAGELPAEGIRDWLSGFIIGREIRSARVWAQQGGDDAARALIVGGDALAGRYAKAFELAGMVGMRSPADSAARGLYRIACASGRVNAEAA